MDVFLNEIIIFGTGSSANYFVKDIVRYNQICDDFNFANEKIAIKCCMDTRVERVGTIFFGHNVISDKEFKEFVSVKEVLVVIATVEYYDQIVAKLEKMNLRYPIKFVDFRTFILNKIERCIENSEYLRFCNVVLTDLQFVNAEEEKLRSTKYRIGKMLVETVIKKEEDNFLLIDGLNKIIESYHSGYYQNEILCYLDEKFYIPMVSRMQVCYQQNRNIIANVYSIELPPLMQDFCYKLYSVNASICFFFDKMEGKFIFYGENDDRRTVSKYDILSKIYLGELFDLYDESVAEALTCLINEAAAIEIFQAISQMIGNNLSIEEKLKNIEKYRELKPFAEGYYWMMGHYYFSQKEYHLSIAVLQKGLDYNPYSRLINFLLGEVYLKTKQWKESACSFLMSDFENLNLRTDMGIYGHLQVTPMVKEKLMIILREAKKESTSQFSDIIDSLSGVVTYSRSFPWKNKLCLNEAEEFEIKSMIAVDESFSNSHNKYFVGIEGNHYQRTAMIKKMEDMFYEYLYTTLNPMCFLSILEGEKTRNVKVENCCLLPLMTKQQYQNLEFNYTDECFCYGINDGTWGDKYNRFIPYKPEYLRIENEVHITSNEDIIIGKPISLEHNTKRKKLVLNILIDGLAGMAIKNHPELMPNTMKFFSKGALFHNAFSPAEWTVVSVPAMFTGCYQEKTRAYYAEAPKYKQLSEEYTTIAEQMSNKGYYCLNLSAVLFSLAYSDVYRGFQKSVGSRDISADVYIMQCINHMQALDETDLFINMHLLDVHDAGYLQNHKMGGYTKNELKKLLKYDKYMLKNTKSVDVEYDESIYASYTAEMQNTDRKLGILFDYITAHYRDDEYLVTLHADHGFGCVDTDDFLLSESRTRIPFMIRGKDVPSDVVSDEMVSGVDLYAIYSHLCGYEMGESLDCVLPKAFGGNGRDYVVTSSPYIGKNYKIAIRDAVHDFRLETLNKVDLYGKVNMDAFRYEILSRNIEGKKIDDVELEKKFIKIAREHVKTILK